MSDDLVADAMLPSPERLVKLHRRLDPPGTSLLSVEQLVVNLQTDLGHREAALGRALSILMPLWVRVGTSDRCYAAPPDLSHAADGPDVLRWVSGKPKEKTVNDGWPYQIEDDDNVDNETPPAMETTDPAGEHANRMVDRYAGSMSDVDWKSGEEDRWAGFSDEELDLLLYGLIEAESEDPDPGTNPLRASLRDEINTVVKRRQIEKTSYRGPGRYRRVGGVVYEVLGVVGTTDALVLRDSAIDPEILFIEQREDFETSEVFGVRRYEYLGPLASAATAPVEVKVVDAGQGWAKVQTIDGRHYVINVGDSITVPTLVIS